MKRRICVLLAMVMLALPVIFCTGAIAEEKDFYVSVESLDDAFAEFQDPDIYLTRNVKLSDLQEEI